MTGFQRTLMRVTVFSALVSIVLGFLGGLWFEALGVAVMSAFGFSLQNLLLVYLVKKQTGLSCYATLRVPRPSDVRGLLRVT